MAHTMDNTGHSDRSNEEQTAFDSSNMEKNESKTGEKASERIMHALERAAGNPKIQKGALALALLADLLKANNEAGAKPNYDVKNDIVSPPSVVAKFEKIDPVTPEMNRSPEARAEQQTATDKVKDFMIDMGQFIDKLANEDNRAQQMQAEIDKDSAQTDGQGERPKEYAASEMDNYKSLDESLAEKGFEIRQEPANDCPNVKDVPLEPIADQDVAESFLNGDYSTVEATENLVLYRVYGGGSEKKGNPDSDIIYLTSREPTDRMVEKNDSALTNRWQGDVKDENGEQKYDENGDPIKSRPNTREYYCEVYVPKGTHMNIGKAAPQFTRGGQLLEGGGEQIVVSKDKVSFGEEKELDYSGNYDKFDRKAKEIEEEVDR